MNLEKERPFIQQQINLEIEKYAKAERPITCSANCPNCCHVKVTCFPEEIDNIMSLGVEIDIEHLEAQFNDWPSSDKTCVFIKDGNCSIQDNKPLHCISHLVNSPAEYCAEGSSIAPHSVISKGAYERLRALRKENGTVILHEEIYKRYVKR